MVDTPTKSGASFVTSAAPNRQHKADIRSLLFALASSDRQFGPHIAERENLKNKEAHRLQIITFLKAISYFDKI